MAEVRHQQPWGRSFSSAHFGAVGYARLRQGLQLDSTEICACGVFSCDRVRRLVTKPQAPQALNPQPLHTYKPYTRCRIDGVLTRPRAPQTLNPEV